MPTVLFYLPVVTPWWFHNIVLPLIKALYGAAVVHILAPPMWRNTGIGPDEVAACSSLPDLQWHIVAGEDHSSLRTKPDDPEGLVGFVRSLNPDYVFCRSADIETPSAFPGKVVHLLEGGAPPFRTPSEWIILQRDFWHHGSMPHLEADDRALVEAGFAPNWARMRTRLEQEMPFCLPRAQALESLGLPTDRKIIMLPLDYEHEEMFSSIHHRYERNIDLIHAVMDWIDDRFLVAITDHPLNYQHIDNSRVHAAIEALGDRARLVPNDPEGRYSVTDLLIKHGDGLIVQNSKAIYSGAMFGTPMLRLSSRPTADWIGVLTEVDEFLSEVTAGRRGAAEDQLRLWYGCHILHEIIDPAAISAGEILDRLDRPYSRERLAGGLSRFEAHQRKIGAA